MERLASAFRTVAVEAGEEALLPGESPGGETEGEESWPEGEGNSSKSPSPSLYQEKRWPLLEAAGVGQRVSPPRKAHERLGSMVAAAQPSFFGEP
jgi:hypothetical protein